MDAAIDKNDVGGITNAVMNYIGKYGIGTDNQVTRAAVSEALKSKGESLTADQLKLITGAAINETEMQVRLEPLIGAIMGYDGSEVAKSKMSAAISEWDRTAGNYIATLPNAHRAFVQGSIEAENRGAKKPVAFKGPDNKEYFEGDQIKTKTGKIATLKSIDGKLQWVLDEK